MSRALLVPAPPGPPLLGHRANGDPIHVYAGAAPADLDDWTPVEYDSEVWQRVMQESVIEREAAPVPMSTRTKAVPRPEGLRVRFGRTYTDDDSEKSSYFLKARKIIARVALDEDDLSDAEALIDVLGATEIDYAISYATAIDHACLGVTAAESDVDSDERPFTSVYRTLRTTHTANPDLGYTADDHYVTWDGSRGVATTGPDGNSFFERSSLMISRVETSRYFSPAESLVIADPAFKDVMRTTLDGHGAPIFKETAAIDRSGNAYDTLYGYRSSRRPRRSTGPGTPTTLSTGTGSRGRMGLAPTPPPPRSPEGIRCCSSGPGVLCAWAGAKVCGPCSARRAPRTIAMRRP
ncbi:hypothetical protein [Nocardiopsis sp. CA-288880]|uniref:hypothetical protein n=1 Tax=Nocardiopsis sp. CA-288880 TaxID=3239995 RepID=UPI003D99902C